MKRHSAYCGIVALVTLIAVSCSEDARPVDAKPSPPRGISLSMTAPTDLTEGNACKISIQAFIERNIFEVVYPDYPDTFPENRVDTMETLFVHLKVLDQPAGEITGIKIMGDSTRTVTSVREGQTYDFVFEAEASRAGRWRLMVEAYYLDSSWTLPPHFIRDCPYRYVWGASEEVTVK